MNEHVLRACRPEPLGAYLKALGVLRLVGEQADADATGRWAGDTFVLASELGSDQLLSFFLGEYRPTPLVAPWNGGSGFKPKDQQAGIGAIEASTGERLDSYREAIAVGRALVAAPEWAGLDKEEQVERCRSHLPDDAIAWLDATVVLTNASRAFPPLLGTGGNVGRLEFSNNFMQRLVHVLWLDGDDRVGAREQSHAWLHASLFDSGHPKLVAAAIGQFDPGAAGGANSSPMGDAGSLVNPWDYVLLLEGALLLSSGAARRLGADDAGKASIPFTVDATPVGYSTAGNESARGELWTPLWHRPASARELERLMGEGRAQWRGRQARTGLDFARAVSSLAVDRGIDSFARHSFVERHGQNMLAVATGRITVHERPGTSLLGQFDPWLEAVRRVKTPPNAVSARLHAVDTAMYEAAARGGAATMQRVLVAVAALERAVGRSRALQRDGIRTPVGPVFARDWFPQLDDRSPELYLAAAVASQRAVVPVGGTSDESPTTVAHYLRPVRSNSSGRRLEWTEGGARVPGLGERTVIDVLGAVLGARAVDASGTGSVEPSDSADEGQRGVDVAFRLRRPAPVEVVAAFGEARLDDRRVEDLLGACLMLDWTGQADLGSWPQTTSLRDVVVPPAWSLLAPFFQPRPPQDHGAEAVQYPMLRPGASWVPLLVAARVCDVLDDAVRRLRIAHRLPIVAATGASRAMAATVDARRLTAMLLVPISRRASHALLDRVSVKHPDLQSVSPSTNEEHLP